MESKGSNLEGLVQESCDKTKVIHPEIDAAIDDGLKLIEHGENAGITRQGVHYYLRKRGMHQRWKQSRQASKLRKIQEDKEKHQGLAQIVNLLEKRLIQLAATRGWAYRKAAEYTVLHKKSQFPLNSIAEFLQRYERALLSGQYFTVPELGQGLNVCSVVLYRILSELKLRTLNRSNARKFVQEERKTIISRGADIPISIGDLAYYSKLPEHVVYYFVKKKGIARPKIKSNIVMFNDKALTYRLASEIYEALDLGFNPSEIVELYGTSEEIVNYASKNKHQLSKFIVKCLRTLYSDRGITKPYV